METLTAEEFKKRYGTPAYTQFGEEKKEDSLFTEIKSAFSQGVNKISKGIEEANPTGKGGVGGLVTGVGKIAGGVSEAVSAPLAPLLNRTIGKAVSYVGDKLSNIPGVQKFAMSPAGEKTAKVAETTADYANAAGLVAGIKGASQAVPKAGSLPKVSLGKTGEYVQGAVRDVVPSIQNQINHQLARALDLTPGDLSNIAKSTGNDIGPWMSDNNLIGKNKIDTLGSVNKFFSENYQNVRSEIGKVGTLFKPEQVPYFTDALKNIAVETQDRLGLESVNKEIHSFLKKEEITLADVQKVKELIDDHFSLYKVTGDVQSGMAKQGLANVRKEIQTFIENEVQKTTGADIRQMNNNVSTARSLANAIETRTPRGLTRAQLTWRDAAVGMGLTYFGSPLAGVAAVAAWKLMTSPTARLRFARWLDSLNDAQKIRVSEAIRDNKVTPEIKKVIGINDRHSESSLDKQTVEQVI